MMQIELTGCTSAGKSTLASLIRQVCQERGTDVLASSDFVLEHFRAGWVKSRVLRTLLLDLFSLSVCLATWRRNFEFYIFAIRTISRLPVAPFEKLNLARNVLKKIGIYEIIRGRSSDQSDEIHTGPIATTSHPTTSAASQPIVLVDEGTLHAAHNLFVHISAEAKACDLETFIRLVPLPDVVVYVTQSESVLIDRTMRRGHKRIPEHSPDKTQIFIQRGINVFDQLMRGLALQRGLQVVESQPNIVVAYSHQNDAGRSVATALEIVRAGMINW
jgi:deoxyadenosine/deoxycytidine kinase